CRRASRPIIWEELPIDLIPGGEVPLDVTQEAVDGEHVGHRASRRFHDVLDVVEGRPGEVAHVALDQLAGFRIARGHPRGEDQVPEPGAPRDWQAQDWRHARVNDLPPHGSLLFAHRADVAPSTAIASA